MLALGLYLCILILIGVYLVYLIVRLLPLVLFAKQPLPFIPIPKRAARVIAQLPELRGKHTIVDLGYGLGHLLLAIRKYHPTAVLTGVEYNHQLVAVSRKRLEKKGIHIVEGDMFTYDLHHVDGIVGWWIGGDFIKKLQPKFIAECQPGCVIVSYMFPLALQPHFTEQVVTVGKGKVYVYVKASSSTTSPTSPLHT